MLSCTISGALFRSFVLLLLLATIITPGCTQPGKNPMPVTTNPVTNAPSATASGVVTEPAGPASITVTPGTPLPPDLAATLPASRTPSTAPSVNPPASGGYIRYTGPLYSVEYPSGWSASRSIMPLYEYRHDLHGCNAAPAYNLDRALHTYSSPEGDLQFSVSIVSTDRDIWPRNFQGNIVYEDVVNSVVGTLETCANSPEGAFTIAGISQVPLDGVAYTGTRADYAKINATGFTVGTGTAYVVTGSQHRGIFLFYRSSEGRGMQPLLGEYMFDSLRLDPGF